MLWVEMSRDEVHGGGDWGFLKCLWSPTRKADGGKQGWWERQTRIRSGDRVLHLRGDTRDAKFVGISTCSEDCEVIEDRPPLPGEWGYAHKFFRTRLENFQPLEQQILLEKVFSEREGQLREYFERNKSRKPSKRIRLFYVVQADRLQCQNGAYFSQADAELASILFGDALEVSGQSAEVRVGEQLRKVLTRLRQNEFSDAVLKNFNGRCCFPKCLVSERMFLIGAHIARWADRPELRGAISNGLCLCLMHDKAFENGLFTLDEGLRVIVPTSCHVSEWSEREIGPYSGKRIKPSHISPSDEAILHHWARIGY